MRFQCTFCFTIIKVEDQETTKMACPNCEKLVAIPKSSLETGCVVDDFVIQNVIGHGGMATVYLARQLSLDRPVALKVLAPEYFEREKYRESFLKEAKAAARLNHPNIIQATRVGEEDEKLFYAMEYVQGQTLANLIDVEKTLKLDQALNIVQQAAEALHDAWTQESLIHRDIKPDNIMLADDGYAKIMDLGIAITVDEAETAEISGTPTYMAPEQFRRERLDCRTDIYSLGVTLFHALCGFPPFDGDNVKEIARKHVFNQLQFPSNDLIYMPQRIKRLISKMMAKEPSDRYQDYDELLGDIVALRKRLAPNEDQIPNVHTISFSKYRLQDKLGDSPSQIYRRRSDQKKKVAIAKEQSEKEAKFKTTTLPGYLIPILVLVICLLAGGIFFVVRTKSQFYKDAKAYLGQNIETTVTLNSDLTAREQQCNMEIRRIDSLLSMFPDKPSSKDTRSKYALLEVKQRLKEIQMEIRFERLSLEQRTLKKQAEDLQALQMKMGLDEKSIDALKKALKDASTELEGYKGSMQARDAEVQRLKTLVEAAQNAQKDVGAELENYKRLQTQELIRKTRLTIVDYCREKKFKNASKLVENLALANDDLERWAKQTQLDLDKVKKVYAAVYNTDTLLKSIQVSYGKILDIDRDAVRILQTVDMKETAVTMKLSKLPAADILLLAEQNWKGTKQEFEAASLAYSLYSGDFANATKQPDKRGEFVKSFVSDYLMEGVAEVRNYLLLGSSRLAKLRYNDIKQYRGLPEFGIIADEFRSLTEPSEE